MYYFRSLPREIELYICYNNKLRFMDTILSLRKPDLSILMIIPVNWTKSQAETVYKNDFNYITLLLLHYHRTYAWFRFTHLNGPHSEKRRRFLWFYYKFFWRYPKFEHIYAVPSEVFGQLPHWLTSFNYLIFNIYLTENDRTTPPAIIINKISNV